MSTASELIRSLLITGFPYDLHERLAERLRLFNRVMGLARAVRRDGSAALDLCYVAAGRADGFWEEVLKPWDMHAGRLILARPAAAPLVSTARRSASAPTASSPRTA